MTFDDAHHDLVYYGEDRDLHRQIIETVLQLPERVGRFALDRCRFLSVGESVYGMTLPGRIGLSAGPGRRSRNMWIILLADPLPEEHALSIIADEIAHAWLKHDRLGNPPKDCEIEAANMTLAWGFTGKGADAEYSNAPFAR